MLQDTETKIELLKEHIYFNYDLMHAKAELREIDFVIEMHDLVDALKLKIPGEQTNELIKISEVYKNNYPKIQQHPDSLYFEALSRLNHRSKFVESFSKPFGLMLSCKLIHNESIKNIFIADNNSIIIGMYSQPGSPFMFIETESRRGRLTTINFVNSVTTKLYGILDFKMSAKYTQITFNDEFPENFKQLSDLNGTVFFACDKIAYSATFNNDITTLKQFQTDINGCHLVSPMCLLVLLENSFVLLDLKENKQEINIENMIVEDDIIKQMELTIPKQKVFTEADFHSLDFVHIVIGMANKTIKVYSFDSKTRLITLFCQVDAINWTYYGYEEDRHGRYWRESLLVQKSNVNKAGLKFAVEDNGILKVVHVDAKDHYEILDEISEEKLGVTEEDKAYKPNEKLQLEDFSNNKITIKLEVEYGKWNVYAYDLGNVY